MDAARASAGEISEALGSAFGRHTARIQSIQGVYLDAMAHSHQLPLIEYAIKHFMLCEGRRPRILIAMMGQDVPVQLKAGAAAVFPPGTLISKTALSLLDTLLALLEHPPVPAVATP